MLEINKFLGGFEKMKSMKKLVLVELVLLASVMVLVGWKKDSMPDEGIKIKVPEMWYPYQVAK